MTSLHRPSPAPLATLASPATPARSRRRIGAVALVSLALIGSAVPAAYAGPDTNIQKPGHVTAQ